MEQKRAKEMRTKNDGEDLENETSIDWRMPRVTLEESARRQSLTC